MPVYIIEGCVATGKSTACKSFVNYLNSNGNSNSKSIYILEDIPEALLNLYLKEMQQKIIPSKNTIIFFLIYVLFLWNFYLLTTPILFISIVLYCYYRYLYPEKRVNKYAFPFQTIIINNRIATMKKALSESENKNIFIDRGIIGDMAFAQMQFDEGKFTKEEFEAYKQMIYKEYPQFIPKEFFSNRKTRGFFSSKNDDDVENNTETFDSNNNVKIIYLKCNVTTALSRLKWRGNKNEIEAYSKEYLQKLIDSHDKIINMFKKSNTNLEIFEIDFDAPRAIDKKNGMLTHKVCEQLWKEIDF